VPGVPHRLDLDGERVKCVCELQQRPVCGERVQRGESIFSSFSRGVGADPGILAVHVVPRGELGPGGPGQRRQLHQLRGRKVLGERRDDAGVRVHVVPGRDVLRQGARRAGETGFQGGGESSWNDPLLSCRTTA
jgi:hypothetical protein